MKEQLNYCMNLVQLPSVPLGTKGRISWGDHGDVLTMSSALARQSYYDFIKVNIVIKKVSIPFQ